MTRIKLWLMAAGSFIAALGGTLFWGWLGWKRAQRADAIAERASRDLDTALRAKEIENEVEALNPADLQSRSRKWVRQTGK